MEGVGDDEGGLEEYMLKQDWDMLGIFFGMMLMGDDQYLKYNVWKLILKEVYEFLEENFWRVFNQIVILNGNFDCCR